MYVLLILVLLGAGAALILRGSSARKRLLVASGALLVIVTIAFFGFLSFWGEYLWFVELGYTARFWKETLARLISAFVAAAVGALLVFLLTLPARRRGARLAPTVLGAAFGAVWGLVSWEVILRFLVRAPPGVRDPIHGRTTSFYLFSLPFYDALYVLLLGVAILALAGAAFDAVIAAAARRTAYAPAVEPTRSGARRYRALFLSLGALALVVAWGRWLAAYYLIRLHRPSLSTTKRRPISGLPSARLPRISAAVLASPPRNEGCQPWRNHRQDVHIETCREISWMT